jgi:hypothetical protein
LPHPAISSVQAFASKAAFTPFCGSTGAPGPVDANQVEIAELNVDLHLHFRKAPRGSAAYTQV